MADTSFDPPSPGHQPLAPDAVWTTRRPGTCLLVLYLAEQATCQVGRLGTIVFRAGWYVYVGSALGGLGPRLRRHARSQKPRHWHIDALREIAPLVRVAVHVGTERVECSIAARVAALPGAARPVARFGASDCRCLSHLFHFADEPDLHLDDRWSLTSLVSTI